MGLQVLSNAVCANQRALIITPKPAGVILRSLRDSITGLVGDEPERARRHLDSVMLSCVFDMDGLWEVLADLDRRTPEIQDSQDEATPPPPPPVDGPAVILITHFSSLLTSLYTQRTKSAAHETLSLLAARLRSLSRALSSCPLILILNSTADSHEPAGRRAASSKPLDPSLCSVFNPPPLSIPGYVPASSRRNKPSFGLVFTQLLDLHLLASRVPRTKEDSAGAAPGKARFVTVVEVLLDEMGLWTGSMGRRLNREQRWAAVDVKDGRVVDAFARRQAVDEVLNVPTSGGFGGRRP
jgi:hypothetical protein